MSTVTKSDAIEFAERGWSVSHPQTNGWMKLIVNYRPTASGMKENRSVFFYGDCSPQDGWEIEYLGER